jgi:tetratricopeptide (TPR) repeat protein
LPASKQLVMGMVGLGKAEFSAGRHDEAVRTLSRALTVATQVGGPDHMDTATVHQILASVLMRIRRLNDAAPHQARALEIVSRTHGRDNGLSALLQMEIARLQLQQGKYRDAAGNFAEAIPIRQRVYGESDMWARLSQGGLGQALLGAGDFDGAGKAFDRVIAALEDSSDDPLLAALYRERATLRLEQRRLAEALADADRGLALARSTAGSNPLPVAQVQAVRAEVLSLLGRQDAARAALDEAARLLEGNESAVARPVVAAVDLARMQLALAQGRVVEARNLAKAVFETVKADENPDALWMFEETAWRRLAEAQRLAGESREACASLDHAITLRSAGAVASDPRLVKAREMRARCAG